MVAYTTAKSAHEVWGSSLYLVDLEKLDSAPEPFWAGAADLQVNDIAWYSDRELLAIAGTGSDGFGIYKLAIPGGPGTSSKDALDAERLIELNSSLTGAKGLAVAPDRQLITFLAPLGEAKGTDIYALRPDGSDLTVLVAHDGLRSPSVGGGRVFPPDGQAIKSYVWTEGHLEYDGYRFSMLVTCGDAKSSTLLRGGFLYSIPSRTHEVILDHEALGVADGLKMQIVHAAYSPTGKLAVTGYYSERDWRADKLAGFWMFDVVDGVLRNRVSLPMPQAPNGIADLLWAPNGGCLTYR
jgi:hypothetical protein